MVTSESGAFVDKYKDEEKLPNLDETVDKIIKEHPKYPTVRK
jgi:hypothetical protein